MAAMLRNLAYYQGIPFWRHVQVIQWATQIVSGILVVALVVWFFANINSEIRERDIPYGFGFLDITHQTPMGQHFLPYDPSSASYQDALIVAFVNTLIVSIVGVILATVLGTVIGVARLSDNWIVAKAALVYIDFFRNVPLLVQLVFWFYIVLALPQAREGYVIDQRFYLNNGGVSIPWPSPGSLESSLPWVILAVAGIAAGVIAYRWLTAREIRTGSTSYPVLVGCGVAVMIGAVGWVVIGALSGEAPFGISFPEAGGFGRVPRGSGQTFSAGLIAVLAGLVMYTAAFIAEIVRAGIQSVSRGQTEASRALGLSGMNTLRHVTFPQALRVIVPPLISQFLNLTKNSSLAGAIGYSDLTNVVETMTQKAPAISMFVLLMLAYLALSLTYSLIGNLYNRYTRY